MFRRTTVACYFCQSTVQPQNARSFCCPHCACWNRYDAHGSIISDDPAMHDETLNSRSFARRASPRSNRLPTEYGKGPFCKDCQTNQLLLVNLRANYLPDPSDPEYARRLQLLPAYEASLQQRYPPVCAACASAVEEMIGERDRMARVSALGGLLKETKGKESARKVSANMARRERVERRLLAWRIRGCLWMATTCASLLTSVFAALGYLSHYPIQFQPLLFAFIFISPLWSFWDPTYSALQKSYLQGRDVRLDGRSRYIKLQLLAWTLRLCNIVVVAVPSRVPLWTVLGHNDRDRWRMYFSLSALLEITILVLSALTLRIRRPPAVRLLDTTSRRLSAPPSSRGSTPVSTIDPDLLAPLSLSSHPVLAPLTGTPIFGQPSLASTSAPIRGSDHDRDGDAFMAEAPDPDAMDWTPTGPPTPTADSGGLLRPQRFFPPAEQPTGLEGLLARTGLSDVVGAGTSLATAASSLQETRWRWGWVYGLSLVPLCAAAFVASRSSSWSSG